MLTAININGFKSYSEATLALSSLTVLIGANASGKSNAIEALRLLSWLAQGQKLSAIQYALQSSDRVIRGRVEDLGYQKSKTIGLGCMTNHPDWNQLNLVLTLREAGLHITKESITAEGAQKQLYSLFTSSEGRNTDVEVFYNQFTSDKQLMGVIKISNGLKTIHAGENIPIITCNDQMAIFTQLDSPASFNAAHKKAQQDIPEVVKNYQSWLGNILFLDPVPALMRGYSFPSEIRLNGDGANLSGVLFSLWGSDEAAELEPYCTQRKVLLEFIQSLPEQDIAGLSFLSEPRGGKLVALYETFGGVTRQYDASLLSDGTLRVLAIAAAMLSATEGSLIVIEEIDNGVHPSRAQHLLTQIKRIAAARSLQVLLSTHNPALLDALPDSAIPNVVFCYRDPNQGSSRLVRLADVPDYPELIAQGTLGHLMSSGALERFVKHHPTGEERKQRALAWLEKIKIKPGSRHE